MMATNDNSVANQLPMPNRPLPDTSILSDDGSSSTGDKDTVTVADVASTRYQPSEDPESSRLVNSAVEAHYSKQAMGISTSALKSNSWKQPKARTKGLKKFSGVKAKVMIGAKGAVLATRCMLV